MSKLGQSQLLRGMFAILFKRTLPEIPPEMPDAVESVEGKRRG